MARADEEAIDTFMSITGVSEPVAIQKLTEHAGNLNEAVNAHFAERDENITNEASVVPQDDLMDLDDPIQPETHRPPFPLLPSPGLMNPFSLFDRGAQSSIFDRVPNLVSSIFDRVPSSASRAPFVSHPREVREIPIEVKDSNEQSSHSGHAPTIQDVTGTENDYGPEIHGTVIIDDEDAEDLPKGPTAQVAPGDVGSDGILSGYPGIINSGPSAPGINNIADYSNDIEEEMIRAAIEASKKDTGSDPMPQQSQPIIEDPELAQAVSLSLKTADQEKALREQGNIGRSSELDTSTSTEVEALGKLTSSGRLEAGGSSVQDKTDEAENRPLVRRRISRSPSSADTEKDIDCTTKSNPQHSTSNTSSQYKENDRHLNEFKWGGISSLEHDEAVMLEAALFGSVPEGNAYHVPYAPGQFRQNGFSETGGSYFRHTPRPPSPSLTAQRLIREQQDDEYFASLQADREKELKAREEAEIRRLEEQEAMESALIEERQKKEELQRKSEEQQEIERQLALKEASLPHEPSPDDGNAINLLVRMPDGSRQGRRFLKSHKLQHLFDFIDVGRVVGPGTYRLVRPYPRRAFSYGESAATFDELGLSGRQEALFLELI